MNVLTKLFLKVGIKVSVKQSVLLRKLNEMFLKSFDTNTLLGSTQLTFIIKNLGNNRFYRGKLVLGDYVGVSEITTFLDKGKKT